MSASMACSPAASSAASRSRSLCICRVGRVDAMHTACVLMHIYILFVIVLDTISIKEWIGADARNLNRAIFDGITIG